MGRPRDEKIPRKEKLEAIETLIENALEHSYDLDVRMYLMEAIKLVKAI